jgi:hypothetical protein
MPAMHTKDSESPPPRPDRGGEPGRGFEDEPRNFESIGGVTAQKYDARGPHDLAMDDPDINTQGSER